MKKIIKNVCLEQAVFIRPKFLKKISRGFTLIELLVVIAIIGVLASVVLASLNSARQKSRDVRRIADIKQLQLALEMYFDSNRQYPPTLCVTDAVGCTAPIVPTYIPAIAKDPISTRVCGPAGSFAAGNYCYSGLDTDAVDITCESYHIGASLEEGGHQALSADSDAPAEADVCTGATADWSGVDAATNPIYDLKP